MHDFWMERNMLSTELKYSAITNQLSILLLATYAFQNLNGMRKAIFSQERLDFCV